MNSKDILTDKEREYLKAVIAPVKDKVDFIEKINCFFNQQQYVSINLDYDCIDLYCFEKNTQFKGMKLDREYTLKELGLE